MGGQERPLLSTHFELGPEWLCEMGAKSSWWRKQCKTLRKEKKKLNVLDEGRGQCGWSVVNQGESGKC